jgi:hypothetical protein
MEPSWEACTTHPKVHLTPGHFSPTRRYPCDLLHLTQQAHYKRTMRFPGKGALLFVVLCLVVVQAALAQESLHPTTATRTLTRHEGSLIVRTALHSRDSAGPASDCSHLVHALYERAGFHYEYASSSDLYTGINEFRPVAKPQPGDLAVWRGHAGIVVNPAKHSFFSMLSSGPGIDFYDSPYWDQWGQPHFFRYIKAAPSGKSSSSVRTASLKP